MIESKKNMNNKTIVVRCAALLAVDLPSRSYAVEPSPLLLLLLKHYAVVQSMACVRRIMEECYHFRCILEDEGVSETD